MLKELETAAPQHGPSTVDPGVVERLESLGYVSGGAALPASALDTTGEDPKDFLPIYQRCDHARAQFYQRHHNEEATRELLEIIASRPALIWPHDLLAEIAMDEQRPANAVQQYAKVVAMLGALKDSSKRSFAVRQDLARAHFGLGLALQQAGSLPEAIGHYEQAVRIVPDFADAHSNLGVVLDKMGRFPEAIAHYEQALRIVPDFAVSHLNLGTVLQKTGRIPEAIAHYEQALRIVPDFTHAHYNLAVALAQEGNLAQAATHYAEAIRLQPDLLEALSNLAWIRATSEDSGLRNGPEAVRLAERACRLASRQVPGALDTLAAAYAEAGRFSEAGRHGGRSGCGGPLRQSAGPCRIDPIAVGSVSCRPTLSRAFSNVSAEAIAIGRPVDVGPDFAPDGLSNAPGT